MLDYGINFNVEEGKKKALKEIEDANKEFQKILDKNKLKVNFNADDFNMEKVLKKVGTSASNLKIPDSIGESIKSLRREFRQLTLEETKAGRGQELLDKYRNLRNEAGLYAGTIDQAIKAQDRSVASTERQTSSFKRQSDTLVQLKSYAMNFLSVYGAIRLTKNMVDITGEFEAQRISLQAILRSAEQGEAIFERIKKLAVISPYTFKDLVGYTKQLSAFSVPYEELYDTTKMLADVSAGLGVDMSRIILAFGQVRSASVLRGQELRQFTEAGIPLVDELAKKFTELNGRLVESGEVFDLISQRKVSFEMVRDIFAEMSSEGGKFYNMQEKLAETLQGKVANLTDAFQIMLAEIGEKGSGVLKGAIDSIRWLMENYDAIGRILLTLVATYGAYRAGLIAATVAENLMNGTYVTKIRLLRLVATAQKALNLAMSVNPYVLATAAIVGLAAGVYLYTTRSTAAERAAKALSDQQEAQTERIKQERSELAGLINLLKDDTSTRVEKEQALKKLQSLMPSVFGNMDIESAKLVSLTETSRLYNEQLERREYLQNKTNLESAKGLLAGKDGDFRWSVADRQQALAFMGKNASKWNVVNTPTNELISDFREWISLRENDLKEYESAVNKVTQNDETKTYKTFSQLKKSYEEADAVLKDLQEQAKQGLIPTSHIEDQKQVVEDLKKELELMGWSEPKQPDINKTKKNQEAIIKAEEKMYELRAKMALEFQKYELDIEQANIDNMRDGAEKRLAQIKLDEKRELLVLEERKQSMIQANKEIAKAKWESEGGQGVFSFTGGLNETQQSILERQESNVNIKRLKSEQDLLNDLLSQYEDYSTKVYNIEKKLQNDIADLNRLRTGNNDEIIDRAIAQARDNAEKELSEFQFDALKNSEAWKVLFSDLENYTVKTLKESLEAVENTDTSGLNPQDAKAVQQAIDKLKESIGTRDPFFAITKGWKDMIKAMDVGDLDAAMDALNRLMGALNEAQEYLKLTGDLVSSAFGETSDAAFAMNTATDIMEANINTGGGVAKILLGDPSGVKDVIKGLTQYINIFKNIRNRKWEKEIERQQNIIDGLAKEYDKLDKAIKKTVGNEYYKTAQKQAENLEKQAAAVQKQIDAERKKGKDTDEQKIKDLEQQRLDLLNESADAVESVIERIAGTDITSAAQDFASAWLDAYKSFGNTSDAIRQKFKDMTENMVVDAVLGEIAMSYLKPIFDMIGDLSEGGLNKGEITRIVNLMSSVTEGLDEALAAAVGEMENLGIDLKDKGETNLTGISKNVAQMSEDTALILGGYLNSFRLKAFEYYDYMMSSTTPFMSQMLLDQAQIIVHLAAIEVNTRDTAINTKDLVDRMERLTVASSEGKGVALNVNA